MYTVYTVFMKRKKKNRGQRALNEETMIIFLRLLTSLRKKLSTSNVVTKAQMKFEGLRTSRAHAILIHLQKDNYIRLERNTYPVLTEKGRVFLETIIQKQKKHWDRRVRIILFDSIQASNNNRVYIRTKIKQYGFMQLVRGAWAYPYPCDSFMHLLQLEYTLENIPLYFTAQDNEHMGAVRKHFRLR